MNTWLTKPRLKVLAAFLNSLPRVSTDDFLSAIAARTTDLLESRVSAAACAPATESFA
jgi:hypothetical protein